VREGVRCDITLMVFLGEIHQVIKIRFERIRHDRTHFRPSDGWGFRLGVEPIEKRKTATNPYPPIPRSIPQLLVPNHGIVDHPRVPRKRSALPINFFLITQLFRQWIPQGACGVSRVSYDEVVAPCFGIRTETCQLNYN